MRVKVNEDKIIQLEEVYNPIALKTSSNEKLIIYMRDSGFEIKYNGEWFSFKNGSFDRMYNCT